ncbi:MAG: PEGA domain-containing protein, partial [Vicinamibacterales bacterium]
ADSFDIVVRDYGPAPVREALRVASQLGSALDFAAAVNVCHGSLHPGDVLVSTEDTRVTGLGIAQALEAIGLAAPVRRPYAAPERVAGGTWDRRADVFSLAALVYEMLCGRPLAGTAEEAAAAVPALAGADSHALREVFARALAENADERFDTALAFVEALQGAFDQAALAAPPKRRRRSDDLTSRRTQPADTAALPLYASVPDPRDEPERTPLEPELTPFLEPPLAPPLEPLLARPDDFPLVDDFELRRAEDSRADLADIAPTMPTDFVAPPPVLDLDGEQLDLDGQEEVDPVSADADVPSGADGGDDAPLSAWADEPAAAVEARDPGLNAADIAKDTADEPAAHADVVSSAVHRAAYQAPADAPRADSGLGRIHDGWSASDNGPLVNRAAGGAERDRSSIWPIALALLVGVMVGFAFGFGVGSRDRGDDAQSASSVAPPSSRPPSDAPPLGSSEAGPSAPPAGPTAASPSGSSGAPAGDAASGNGVAAAAPTPPAAAPPASPPPRAAAAAGPRRLLVRSRPSGARVTLDGRAAGTTPLTLRDVRPGAHRVRIALRGYVTADRRVRISAAQPAQSIDVNLVAARAARGAAPVGVRAQAPERGSGTLMIDSRPTGARVRVDGKLVGTTPMLMDAVSAGQHAVRLELEGFSAWTAAVTVSPGERARVSGSLEP